MKRQNDRKLGEILGDIYNNGKMGDKLIEKKIQAFWRSEMGASINSRTESVSYRANTVFIKVSSAPLRQQMVYETEAIRKRILEYIPAAVIDRIKVL